MQTRTTNGAGAPGRRRRLRRTTAGFVVLLLLLLALGGAAGAQGSTPMAPSLTAVPDTMLVDEQILTVEGAGWPAGSSPAIVQCATSGTGPASCDTTRFLYVTADASGNFSTGFEVRRLLFVGGELVDCAEAGACNLSAGIPPDGSAGSASTPIRFDPDQPLPPLPSLSVTPGTGLIQGQTVSVQGSDYDPGSVVGIVQCRIDSQSAADCNIANLVFVPVAADGTFGAQFMVQRILYLSNGEVIDCVVVGCEVGAGTGQPRNDASTPIEFDPDQPLPPPPSIVVTPSTGLTDGQQVEVRGRDYPMGSMVGIIQCKADAGSVRGCDTRTQAFAPAGPGGDFTTTFTVKQVLETGEGTIDCAVDPCWIGAGVPPNGDPAANATISFTGGGSGGDGAPSGTGQMAPRFTG